MNWWGAADGVVAALLLPLATWVLISGIDDLIIDIAGFVAHLRMQWAVRRPSRKSLRIKPKKRIAIFVPCWREHAVIGAMIERNNSSLLYGDQHFFVGAYPNDSPTLSAIDGLTKRFRNVHLALCPHPGPTSKADCLNWIYQRMLLFERERRTHFDVVVTHDAEDVIHPESLHWINYFTDSYEMVQVPVLPLPTPSNLLTHGVYCDEFAEYQARDMPARQTMGAFVPSNGVGTGFRRDALERLAESDANRVFEPGSLTEDYENGLRLKLQGARQFFLPVQFEGIATREYFPQTVATAIRQRTRWVTGIALQTWERHGWPGNWVQKYWLWRDRKGLIGNPASLLTNLLYFYGALSWLHATAAGEIWVLAQEVRSFAMLLACTSVIGAYRMIYRAICVGKIFGWSFAAYVPLRILLANFINSCASVEALRTFVSARVGRRPLVWLKTEHYYPSAAALDIDRRQLGEVLVCSGYIRPNQLADALAAKPAQMRLGEYLVERNIIDEDALYEALSLHFGLPQRRIAPEGVPVRVARALPKPVVHEWRVLPIEIDSGRFVVGSPDPPEAELRTLLSGLTRLEVRFHLLTPSNFKELTDKLL